MKAPYHSFRAVAFPISLHHKSAQPLMGRRLRCLDSVSSFEDTGVALLVSGVLYKQRNSVLGRVTGPLGWVPRWFELTPAGLFYFLGDSEPTRDARPRGFIDLSQGKYFRVARGHREFV